MTPGDCGSGGGRSMWGFSDRHIGSRDEKKALCGQDRIYIEADTVVEATDENAADALLSQMGLISPCMLSALLNLLLSATPSSRGLWR